MWKIKRTDPWAVTAWLGISAAIAMLAGFSVWSS